MMHKYHAIKSDKHYKLFSYETINEYNKKFKNDFFSLDLYGRYKDPLFKAIDTAKILDIKNIRQNLSNLKAIWYWVCLTYTTNKKLCNMIFTKEPGIQKMQLIFKIGYAIMFHQPFGNLVHMYIYVTT